MGGSLSSPGRRGLKQELYNAVEAAPGETEALGQEEPGSGRKRRGSLEEAFWARRVLSVDGVQALLLLL